MTNINPLRYRGYYYDTETGFYYLQSRYYDPVNHRFINADVYASTDSTDAISCNMFAYCGNNPVGRTDESGEGWLSAIVGGVIGAIVGCVSAAVTGGDVASIIAGTVGGAVGGAIVGLTGDWEAGKVAGRIAGSAVVATATFIDAKIHGASTGSAFLAAGVNFGIAYGVSSLSSLCGDDALASGMVDTVLGFGGTLSGAGLTELITGPSKERNAQENSDRYSNSNYRSGSATSSFVGNSRKNQIALIF